MKNISPDWNQGRLNKREKKSCEKKGRKKGIKVKQRLVD